MPPHPTVPEKWEQAHRTPHASRVRPPSPTRAKRMECVRLAGAVRCPHTRRCPKSGSKLTALHTLREYARRLQLARSVWSASGLPALLDAPTPDGARKAGASSPHTTRFASTPAVVKPREAYGVRP